MMECMHAYILHAFTLSKGLEHYLDARNFRVYILAT